MKLGIRQLIGLMAVSALVSAGACKQEKSPTDSQFTARSIGGGADQTALAETIVALLFIARKQARDTGGCVQDEQRLDRRSGEDRALEQLRCDHSRDKKQSAHRLIKISG
jgi:hypothetical protein